MVYDQNYHNCSTLLFLHSWAKLCEFYLVFQNRAITRFFYWNKVFEIRIFTLYIITILIHQGTHSGPKIKGHFAISITYSVFDPVNGSWVPCLELDDEGNVTHVGTHLEVDTAKISCPIDLSTGKPNYRY
jgi:hypothetical protein